MKHLKKFNENFFSNFMYKLFRDDQQFKNRIKITDDILTRLKDYSSDKGLNIDDSSTAYVYAWKEGNDKMEWNYDGKYLYYNSKYADIINNLVSFSDEEKIQELIDQYLAFLSDDGFDIKLIDEDQDGFYAMIIYITLPKNNFKWDDIMDYIIPFLHILSNDYNFTILTNSQNKKNVIKQDDIINNEEKVYDNIKDLLFNSLEIDLTQKRT